MTDDVRLIRADQRTPGPSTSGMIREEAVATEGMWAGLATTEPGSISGWHHHAGFESAIFVLSGALRMEFGPGGTEVVDAGPGDYVYVAPGVIHRESNPTDGPAEIVVVRAGSGVPVVNVDGPSGGLAG
jgi:uncharacterized RmlC-like cupin family protein